ncbi:MAG TPA: hypothetical protein P5232_01525 [Candidatus Moranbacteria bacterium]|nr:hypothetical protein [Candidatus Moranbacteria bacterium]
MPNINLAIGDVSKTNSDPAGKGLVFAVAVLIITIVLYGALLIVNRVLSSKIDAVKNEYSIEYSKFLSGKGNEIVDFKNRSDVAGKIITENKSMADVLGKVESSMLSSVYLDSFKYEKAKKTVSLLCVGDSFDTVAKQILSFKQNDYFSAVIPGRSFLDSKNNKLNFSIDLIIK